jgi:hypothetical protein
MTQNKKEIIVSHWIPTHTTPNPKPNPNKYKVAPKKSLSWSKYVSVGIYMSQESLPIFLLFLTPTFNILLLGGERSSDTH